LIISFRKADKTPGGVIRKCFEELSTGGKIHHYTKLSQRFNQAQRLIKNYGKEFTRKDRKDLELFIHAARKFLNNHPQ
jgi:hypothetical protein